MPPREHHSIGAAPQGPLVHCSLAVLDALRSARDNLQKAEHKNQELACFIDNIPTSEIFFNYLFEIKKFGTRNLIQNEIADADVCNLDPELLLLKATSQATILCLGQCLSILQEQQIVPRAPPQPRVKKTPLHYIPPQPIDLAEKTKRWDHDCRSSLINFKACCILLGQG